MSSTWLTRLIGELEQLKTNIDKLEAALDNSYDLRIPLEQIKLMSEQLKHMKAYAAVLEIRVEKGASKSE